MSGKTFVIKLGGELMEPPQATQLAAICQDLGALQKAGHTVVVVHGGGPQATALQKRLGLETRTVGGRRITDDATLEVMKMAVAGQVNVDVCARLIASGARPVGLNGSSALAIEAHKRPPSVVSGGGPDPVDFGHVGDVDGVNTALLGLLTGAGYMPVLSCLGMDKEGRAYNINADTVANGVASSLKAAGLIMVTGTPGVLRDIKDPASRMGQLNRKEAQEAIQSGAISGGMIPKVEEAFKAMDDGVAAVFIVGKLQPGDLAKAVLQPGSVGTALTA